MTKNIKNFFTQQPASQWYQQKFIKNCKKRITFEAYFIIVGYKY